MSFNFCDEIILFLFFQAKEILANWGLQIDPQMVRWEGRRLPYEKILFRKAQVLAGEEADWGRDAVKQQLISTVSSQLVLWMYHTLVH